MRSSASWRVPFQVLAPALAVLLFALSGCDDPDNDAPLVSIETDSFYLYFPQLRVPESAGSVQVKLKMEFALPEQASVNYTVFTDSYQGEPKATAGADYVGASGTLVFAPGETEKTVTIQILNDSASEGDEWFRFRLTGHSANVELDPFAPENNVYPTKDICILDDDGHATCNLTIRRRGDDDELTFGWATTNPAGVVVEPDEWEARQYASQIFQFPAGAQVSVTAVPDAGATFHHWEGDIQGTSNPITVTMSTNKELRPIFMAQTFSVVEIEGNGTVTSDPPGPYRVGTRNTVRFTANPAPGHVIAKWELYGIYSENPKIIEATAAITETFTYYPEYPSTKPVVKAFFAPAPAEYKTLATATAGTGSGTVVVNPAGTSFAAGTKIVVEAVPGAGSTFAGWSGSLSGTQNPARLTMDGDKSVTATFTGGGFVRGDADGDGAFTAGDVNTVIDWVIGRLPTPAPGTPRFLAADVNNDGAINPADINIQIDILLGRVP